MAKKTLYDKIWDDHLVDTQPDGTCVLYIDRHLVHEVTSPQAFEGLRLANRKVRAPEKTLAVVDHNVPTTDRTKGIDDPESRLQVDTLAKNCKDFGVEYFNEVDIRQGIVHVIGPEQGFTLPGTTIVCGDSHTSTHGAFGALAHGIGTSEVEHVLATQTLIQSKAKNMKVTVDGKLPKGRREAEQLGVLSIDRTGETLAIKFSEKSKIDPQRLLAFIAEKSSAASFSPNGILRVKLMAGTEHDLAARVFGALRKFLQAMR